MNTKVPRLNLDIIKIQPLNTSEVLKQATNDTSFNFTDQEFNPDSDKKYESPI